MGVLAHRHIKVSPQCPICQQEAEDIRHLLFTCMRAQTVWSALGISDLIDRALAVNHYGSVVLEELLRWPKQKSPVLGQLDFQETVAIGAWYI